MGNTQGQRAALCLGQGFGVVAQGGVGGKQAQQMTAPLLSADHAAQAGLTLLLCEQFSGCFSHKNNCFYEQVDILGVVHKTLPIVSCNEFCN